jgi:hypothetical protein
MARIVRESFAEDELAVYPGDAALGKAFVDCRSIICSSPGPRRSAAWWRRPPRRT